MRATKSLMAALLVAGAAGLAAPAQEKLAPPTAAELRLSANNLKQIMLAMHNYHDANGNFPNNTYTKDGKGLLSWRVALLPYIEQDKLYKEFKLNEPWDSDANKKLIAKLPKQYAPVRVKGKEGETFYRAFAGKDMLFGPDQGKGAKIFAITDGTSNTGMVFEAADPVVWTKPDDLEFDAKKPLPKLGGHFDGDFYVARADGSVVLCKKDADEAELKKFITPRGGEILDMKKIQK